VFNYREEVAGRAIIRRKRRFEQTLLTREIPHWVKIFP
jgi:hypothetical protein